MIVYHSLPKDKCFRDAGKKTPLKSSDAALDAAIPSCSCTAIFEILEKKRLEPECTRERHGERQREKKKYT